MPPAVSDANELGDMLLGPNAVATSHSALFVTTVASTLEAFLTPFADSLRAQGWTVDALANGASSNKRIAEHFDRLYDVTWSRNPLSPGNLLGTAPHVRDLVRDGDYDIVHVHTPIAAFVTRFALRHRPRGQRPAVIYTAHGFHFYEGQSWLPHLLFRSMERLGARWTDFIVTINAEDFAAANMFGGIAPDRVRLIPGIGVDTELFAPGRVPAEKAARFRTDLGVAPDDFLLVMVAEFSAVKRHSFVLEALSLVRNPRVVIAFVGEGPLEDSIRRAVDARGLANRVRFAGYRRDIPVLLAASDALLLASEREGLNRSALEAMASGRPVIGTDTRGIADAVGKEAGWIVAKNDPAALAGAIDAAAADPAEVTRRGSAARERAVAQFALPRIVDAYEELYREALASRV